jgi:MFS family permease
LHKKKYSFYILGAAFGSYLAFAIVKKKISRRFSLIISDGIYVLGTILLIILNEESMVVGRFITGISVGNEIYLIFFIKIKNYT